MKGPISKDIKVGFGLDGLEVATFFAGLLVVIGLVMESGPEAWTAIIKRIWPHREVTGNVLVTIGVFAEVAIGLFIARSAKRAQLLAEAQIAELSERAASAELAAAEANLARVKLEQRMKPRNIFGPGREDLKAVLDAHSGMSVDIVVYDSHVDETKLLGHILMSLFVAAKWRCRHWEARKAKSRVSGASVLVGIANGHVDEKLIGLAEKLRAAFLSMEIECDISLGQFSCKGDFEPGDFQVMNQYPTVPFGVRALSSLRIQIGALQLVPVPPTRIVIGIPGPKV